MQRLGKQVPAGMNTQRTTEELPFHAAARYTRFVGKGYASNTRGIVGNSVFYSVRAKCL
jgi:hypothetical protein